MRGENLLPLSLATVLITMIASCKLAKPKKNSLKTISLSIFHIIFAITVSLGFIIWEILLRRVYIYRR